MSSSLAGVLAIVALALAAAVLFGGRLPAHYRARSCQAKRWRERFPRASKHEIREFLSLFIAAFGFDDDQKLKLHPDDEVLALYRALYPSRLLPDALELETLAQAIERRYHVGLSSVWQERLTLGQLYLHVNVGSNGVA
jgi:hypothetical protein